MEINKVGEPADASPSELPLPVLVDRDVPAKGKRPKVRKTKKAKEIHHQHRHIHPLVQPLAPVITLMSVDAATREQVSQFAMLASITKGTFEDVKFYAFSRRRSSARLVDTPLPLYGNSVLIRKASTHFDLVLTRGFGESGIADLDAPYPPDRPSSMHAEDHGYASDSDLDDEPDSPQDDDSIVGSFPKLSLGQPVHPNGHQAEASATTEVRSGSVEDRTKVADASKAQALCPARPGRVVFLDDIAYRTWQAFIFYAYFGQIVFAPLKSQERAAVRPTAPYDPPLCSPKSLYRLADKYGIEDLKTKAAEDIKTKLTTENVLTELFSSFTLTHPEIQKMEVEFLYERISDPNLLSRLPKWFQYLESGELPSGAADVFSTLVNRLVTGRAS